MAQVPHVVDRHEPTTKTDSMLWSNPEEVVNGMVVTRIWDADNAVWLLVGGPGPQGEPGIGEAWHSQAGAPPAGVGNVGDWSLDINTGAIYEKIDPSTWTLRANIMGPSGAPGSAAVATDIEMGGDTENTWVASNTVDFNVFQDGISITFVKPAGWTSYRIMVWGAVGWRGIGYAGASVTCRIVIDGNNGERGSFTGVDGATSGWQHCEVSARHERTGLIANAVLKVQWQGMGSEQTGPNGQKQYSHLQYLAVKLT